MQAKLTQLKLPTSEPKTTPPKISQQKTPKSKPTTTQPKPKESKTIQPKLTQPTIAIDKRESQDYKSLLETLGAKTQTQTLSIADFILSERCAVERKSRQDFEASIIDGRLFEQAKRLKETYEKPLLIIEGAPDANARLKKQALLGAYASLITDYSIPLFFTKDPNCTSQLLYSIAKYEQISQKNPLRIKARKKANSFSQSQRAIIESLPKVGPKLAIQLLNHFKTPKKVFSATEKQLKKAPGMGEVRAKLLFNTINSVFCTKNED